MDRRSFICAFTTLLVLTGPLVVRAQTVTTLRRIGWLYSGTQLSASELEEEIAPLRELGWIEGRNLLVERRYPKNNKAELLLPLAEELVRLKVELIVTEGTVATLAAKSATNIIPIVIRSSGDPVSTGLVASLARPGGNITGYSVVGPGIHAKSIALLRELVPSMQRMGVLEPSAHPYYRVARKDFEEACRRAGIQPIFLEVAAAAELESAVAEAVRQRAQALFVQNESLFFDNRVEIARAALRHALPTLVQGKKFLEAGALISYTFSWAELHCRGAAFIDKILRGAKPRDLPIEQPTQFVLGINLRTAKELGITVPQSLLLRADQVIQ
jgi:putative tryptophan/tyrosine transport system substrate-binding protein